MEHSAQSHSASYKAAGVDVTAGYEAIRLFKEKVRATYISGVLGDVGGFGGLFEPNLAGLRRPVLVSGTDGVGTKLKIAFTLDQHDTIGIDCVAMCANDVVCAGAAPLFFLDYLACGKNKPQRVAAVVGGVAEGCRMAGCALIGGETAEMPGFYPEDEYDLAGFCVGVADYDQIIDGKSCRAGDAVIAVASSGVHSNGFSLIRKIMGDDRQALNRVLPELGGTVGEALLTPTKIYVKPMLALMRSLPVKAVSHITGGGFYENIPRMLPTGLCACVERKNVRILPIFEVLAREGGIPERDMFNTFNMGAGMVFVTAASDASRAIDILAQQGETAYVLGELRPGDDGIRIV